MQRFRLLTFLFIFGTIAGSGHALDVRINFSTNGAAGNWTNITNLRDDFTVIDFQTGEDIGATASSLFSTVGGALGSGEVLESWVTDFVLSGHAASNFNGGTLNLANFPAGTYRVEVLASRNFEIYGGRFTVNGEAPDTTYRGGTPPEVWEQQANGLNPLDWQIWSEVTVADDGKLDIIARISEGNNWISINAVRITGTPSARDEVSAMSNLSVRSVAGSGDNTLVVGYAIAGGDKSVLVRGVGPSLSNFDVTGAVSDARLRMFDNTQTELASNTNWGGDDTIAAAAEAVGAFSIDAASRDAALLSTQAPGAYSVHVESGAGSGIALAEIYDTDFGNGGYLSNVSARAGVSSGDNVLIVGLVVSGEDPVTVLIRGIGPALADFDVRGVLADPELKLFRQGESEPIQTNDNWGGTHALTSAFNTVGAFTLNDGDSADAAMLVELTAGTYTAQVSGVGGTGGVALVELYIMP